MLILKKGSAEDFLLLVGELDKLLLKKYCLTEVSGGEHGFNFLTCVCG